MTGVAQDGDRILCQTGYQGLKGRELIDWTSLEQWPAAQTGLDIGSVRTAHRYNERTMGVCPRDEVYTGIHKGRNARLCASLEAQGSLVQAT